MRYKAGHREEAKARILQAIGRGFRKHGYGGIGVDGLAREAEVTSGAFYGHFASKADAFGQAVSAGMRELREGVQQCQAEHGTQWIERFVDFYLNQKRTCALAEACALQTLTPEVMRAEEPARLAYQDELRLVIEQIASGLAQADDQERRARAWALLALLSGCVSTARALSDPQLIATLVGAAQHSALQIAYGENPPER